MDLHSRFQRWMKTTAAVLAVAMLLVIVQVGAVFAGTTGNVNGTVTDATTNAPVAGVNVTVAAPTQTAKTATTDSKGFFSITGLSPDTYTVTVTGKGYGAVTLSGITVEADQTATLTPTVSKSLANIGRTAARSTAGAFQPTQTQNTYTVNSAQIGTLQGNPNNISETNLLTSLPGASLDKSGYPILRGGRENEEGFQFEGISYTDPITNQFVNSLTIHGAQSFQLIPGAGPASQGNNGTGTINIVAKRGSRPNFSSFDLEDTLYPAPAHQFRAEYGWATPNGRISNYTSFVGSNFQYQYGAKGTTAAENGLFFGGTSSNPGRDIINNFVYKFGKDNSQSLQFFYQNQYYAFLENYGGVKGLRYAAGDPNVITPGGIFGIDGFNLYGQPVTGSCNAACALARGQAEAQSILGFMPGQGPTDALRYQQIVQPNQTFKLEYTNSINASTFLTARYYKVNADTIFDLSNSSQPFFGGITDDYLTQGGLRTGYSADITKQLGSKHLVQAGMRYEYLLPIDNSVSYDYGFQLLSGFASYPNGRPVFQGYNFLGGSQPDGPGFLGTLPQYPNGTFIPPYFRIQDGSRGDWGYYVADTWSPTSNLKVEYGARLDQYDYHFYPQNVFDPNTNTVKPLDPKYKKPSVLEPRIAASWRLNPRNSIRASYGISSNTAPLGFNQRVQNPLVFAPFAGLPAQPDPVQGNAGNFATSICGIPLYNQPCASYADQLLAIYQRRVGQPYQPTLPETFANYDFSVSHSFSNDLSMRVTPFYRKGYNGVIRQNVVQGFSPTTGKPILSPAVATNNGRSNATGLEFYLVKENRNPYGLSGSLSLTYLNEFSNVIPGSASEDFFPTVPAASLQLGNQYRVGFASPLTGTLAVEYKTRKGLRIVPNISYSRGYPIGTGTLTGLYVNGVPLNVPLTDYTGAQNGVNYSQFLDPQNPGTVVKPNIAANLGVGDRSSAGSLLSKANFSTGITVEYAPTKRGTLGVQVFNLFNQLYGGAGLNTALQPVANGIVGPQTGYLPNYYAAFANNYGLIDTPVDQFRGSSYNVTPNGAPRTINFYYRVSI